MNTALIHDRYLIKNFWEQKIDNHSQQAGTEDDRMKGSALGKLRGEWSSRLENRTKHLKTFNESLLRRSKLAQN